MYVCVSGRAPLLNNTPIMRATVNGDGQSATAAAAVMASEAGKGNRLLPFPSMALFLLVVVSGSFTSSFLISLLCWCLHQPSAETAAAAADASAAVVVVCRLCMCVCVWVAVAAAAVCSVVIIGHIINISLAVKRDID